LTDHREYLGRSGPSSRTDRVLPPVLVTELDTTRQLSMILEGDPAPCLGAMRMALLMSEHVALLDVMVLDGPILLSAGPQRLDVLLGDGTVMTPFGMIVRARQRPRIPQVPLSPLGHALLAMAFDRCPDHEYCLRSKGFESSAVAAILESSEPLDQHEACHSFGDPGGPGEIEPLSCSDAIELYLSSFPDLDGKPARELLRQRLTSWLAELPDEVRVEHFVFSEDDRLQQNRRLAIDSLPSGIPGIPPDLDALHAFHDIMVNELPLPTRSTVDRRLKDVDDGIGLPVEYRHDARQWMDRVYWREIAHDHGFAVLEFGIRRRARHDETGHPVLFHDPDALRSIGTVTVSTFERLRDRTLDDVQEWALAGKRDPWRGWRTSSKIVLQSHRELQRQTNVRATVFALAAGALAAVGLVDIPVEWNVPLAVALAAGITYLSEYMGTPRGHVAGMLYLAPVVEEERRNGLLP